MKFRNTLFVTGLGAVLVAGFAYTPAKAFFWNGPCAVFWPGNSGPHTPFATGPGPVPGYGGYAYPQLDPRYTNRYPFNRALRPPQSYAVPGATRRQPPR